MVTWRQKEPGERGIPKEAVEELESSYQRLGLRVHGYLLLSGDAILAERYYEGYDKDSLHRMYSVAKTFVALAVGVMAGEGLVSLEDQHVDIFL